MTFLSILQVPLFELFQKTHYAIAIVTAYAVWRHLPGKSSSSRIYMVVASSIFIVTCSMRYSRLIFRNLRWGEPYAKARITQIQGAIRVRITVPRPWKIRPGDFIYIWMPGVSFWSSFQSHPFMVSWWDQNVDGKGANIYLLVKPKSGFTQKLLRHSGSEALRVWIDGPYGRTSDIGDYGSVIMFATGIGIAAQVPYIKQLLRGFQEYRVRTKSILLVWQLDSESVFP